VGWARGGGGTGRGGGRATVRCAAVAGEQGREEEAVAVREERSGTARC
jgi:hypothetical protein